MKEQDHFLTIMALLVTTIIVTVLLMELSMFRLDSVDPEVQQMIISTPFDNGTS